MAADANRSQHLQRALLGLRQFSTTLRSVSGSLGTASHPLADGDHDLTATVDCHEQRSNSGSRHMEYAAQVSSWQCVAHDLVSLLMTSIRTLDVR